MANQLNHPHPLTFNNTNGSKISSWDEWEDTFRSSGKSLAQFILDNKGGDHLRAWVSKHLRQRVEFHTVTPGLAVPFDNHGKSHVHDIGIYGAGEESKKSLFVGVMVKGDEPFGEVVKDVYDRAMKHRNAGSKNNVPDVVEDLLAVHFPASPPDMWKIRDQLLYATAGTLAVGSGMSVLYVIEFPRLTHDWDKLQLNLADFRCLMNLAGAINMGETELMIAYKLTLDGRDLYFVYEYINRP